MSDPRIHDRPLQDFGALPLGLYVVHWREGGSSLAAVGMGRNGTRWLAPTNWIAPSTNPDVWLAVWRVERVPDPRNDEE